MTEVDKGKPSFELRKTKLALAFPSVEEIFGSVEDYERVMEYIRKRRELQNQISEIQARRDEREDQCRTRAAQVARGGGAYRSNMLEGEYLQDTKTISSLQTQLEGLDRDGENQDKLLQCGYSWITRLILGNPTAFSVKRRKRKLDSLYVGRRQQIVTTVVHPSVKHMLEDGHRLSLHTDRDQYYYSDFDPSVAWEIELQSKDEQRVAGYKVKLSYGKRGQPRTVGYPITTSVDIGRQRSALTQLYTQLFPVIPKPQA